MLFFTFYDGKNYFGSEKSFLPGRKNDPNLAHSIQHFNSNNPNYDKILKEADTALKYSFRQSSSMVEQALCKRQVVGSIPTSGSRSNAYRDKIIERRFPVRI